MNEPLDLTIVIVNHNTREHLATCLDSIFSHPMNVRFCVHVVDNDSTDGSQRMVRERFPEVVLTSNRDNVGFAKGNNQILNHVKETRYFLLLNPDVIVSKGSVEKMLQYMDSHPEAGITGCRLLNPDGSLQYSCRAWPQPLTILARGLMVERLFPEAGRFRHYFMKAWDHGQVADVDWVLGSCMLIRREALEDVGAFDENFYMYYEDVDLCLRMRQKQWHVYYLPEPTMIHHHIQESHKLTSMRIKVHHIKSVVYFFNKHGLFKPGLLGRNVDLENHFRVLS